MQRSTMLTRDANTGASSDGLLRPNHQYSKHGNCNNGRHDAYSSQSSNCRSSAIVTLKKLC